MVCSSHQGFCGACSKCAPSINGIVPLLPTNEVRALAVLYALLVLHLSLYPYTNWRELGVSAFDYFSSPWVPPHQSILWRDITINVLGYIPLGILLTLGLFPRLGGLRAVVFASLLISGLSCLLEAVQTFLPMRVPSRLDWLTNSLGGVIGCWLATSMTTPLLNSGRLAYLRLQWLEGQSPLGLVTQVLWLFALLSPQALPFVVGPWLGDIWVVFSSHLGLDDVQNRMAMFFSDWEDRAAQLATVFCLMGAWVLALAHTRRHSPRLRMMAVLAFLTLLVGWLGPQLLPWVQGEALHSPHEWDVSVLIAIVLAVMGTFALCVSRWERRRLATISMVLTAAGWVCTIFLPGYSPIITTSINEPLQRVIDHVNAASAWVAMLWPLLSLAVAINLSRA